MSKSVGVVDLGSVGRKTRLCPSCQLELMPDLQWVRQWHERWLVTKADRTAQTYSAEVVRMVVHLHRLGASLAGLTPQTAGELLFDQSTGWMGRIKMGKTWKIKRVTLSQFFLWLVTQQGAPFSAVPVTMWPSAPRESKVVRVPSKELVERLLLAPMHRRKRNELESDARYRVDVNTLWRDTLMIGLAAYQGLRANEIANGLIISNVYVREDGGVARSIAEADHVRMVEIEDPETGASRLEEEIIVIGKGRKERKIMPTARASHLLKLYLGERICHSPHDRRVIPLSNSHIRATISSYAKEVGLETRGAHVLRHFFASLYYLIDAKKLIQEGKSRSEADRLALINLRDVMGHASVEETKIYVHNRLVEEESRRYVPGEVLPPELIERAESLAAGNGS